MYKCQNVKNKKEQDSPKDAAIKGTTGDTGEGEDKKKRKRRKRKSSAGSVDGDRSIDETAKSVSKPASKTPVAKKSESGKSTPTEPSPDPEEEKKREKIKGRER